MYRGLELFCLGRVAPCAIKGPAERDRASCDDGADEADLETNRSGSGNACGRAPETVLVLSSVSRHVNHSNSSFVDLSAPIREDVLQLPYRGDAFKNSSIAARVGLKSCFRGQTQKANLVCELL
jgi:hypothetical protein